MARLRLSGENRLSSFGFTAITTTVTAITTTAATTALRRFSRLFVFAVVSPHRTLAALRAADFARHFGSFWTRSLILPSLSVPPLWCTRCPGRCVRSDHRRADVSRAILLLLCCHRIRCRQHSWVLLEVQRSSEGRQGGGPCGGQRR